MKRLMQILLPAVLVGLFAVGCGSGSAGAGSGLSEAQVQKMIKAAVSPLEERIAGLEAGTVLVYSSSSTSGQSKTSATPANLACGGSLGYTPANDPAWKMTAVYCKSTTGYMVGLPITDRSVDVLPVTADARILYQTNDCTGTAFIHWSDVGALGLNNGLVLSYQDATGKHVGSIAPQASPVNMRQFGSWMEGGTCTSLPHTHGNTLEIMPNDPSVTGVQASYTGPILIE